ncbi:hypothetical protein A3E96_02020 [Candidatus Uhrbacteria bacterium RIFCSPHIGHO2_12_FULL_46_13]|nr:MAG: hypothetical protein A3E96_02020 [Candidatus Uhrbacteria bacterium RIFCSPHIGHO2_12_FULL_46_13]
MDIRECPRGYSIVEALVTLFIVATVVTLSLANYRTAQNAALLRQTVVNVEGALRDAQQHALAGTVADTGATYGYGVHFDTTALPYTVYADKDDDNDLFFDGEPTDFKFANQPESRPAKISLTIGVTGACGSSNAVDVAFQPPLPSVSIKKEADFVSDCDIACLDLSLGGKTSRVKVTRESGLIETINNQDPAAGCST